MKKTLLFTACLMSHTAFAQIQGVVIDEQGEPIAGASIDIVGSNQKIKTDENGAFNLPSTQASEIELHIKAPQFMHRTFHLPQGDQPVELVLYSTAMEVVNVVGLPWHASNMESAQPVSVLGGETLRKRQASTLGETLKYEVGVHSSYYGPVASSPIIRGLEGPRVLISQNGLDAGDASRVGPDHAVATEASTARQIEILRGPATLFYGSGAIGGVVNIVDDRVPKSTDTNGEWRLEGNSVADDKLVSASANSGVGDVGLHIDGFWRDANDYKIPGPAELEHEDDGEHEHEEHADSDRLENTASEAKGINLGGSFIVDDEFVGLSYGRLERQYGIPGHAHGEEEVDVYADLTQDRVQLISELSLDNNFFGAVNTRIGFTDYEHSEIEGTEIGTTFANKTHEARVELFHHPISDWRGALSAHYKRSDFSAVGEEAFTPPSITTSMALALMEERHIGELLIQLGARIEHVEIDVNEFRADLGEHDGENHLLSVFAIDHTSTPFSASAGAVWNFTDGHNLAVSYTHSQRTPSAAELVSFGPHLGSGLYEVGALLEVVEDEPGEFHFDLTRHDAELEISNNLDISLRKFEGDIGFIFNTFYNAIDNYYYLAETGLISESAHEEEGHEGHGHGEGLPVYIYQARDANLYGFEGEFVWQVSTPFKLTLTSDYIRARLNDGGDLPRIPPMRLGARVEYQRGDWHTELSGQHYFEQDKTAELESDTGAYTLVDLQVSYSLNEYLKIYAKGQNLTDEYARVHASFLKDTAPLPARSFALGISGSF